MTRRKIKVDPPGLRTPRADGKLVHSDHPRPPPKQGDSSESQDKSHDNYSGSPSGSLLSLVPDQPAVFAGFDDAKLGAPLKLGKDGMPVSAKYTFAKLAMTSNTMPQTAKQAEDWFNTHIREGMEAKGFRIGWVRGDQALIATRESPAGELIGFWRGPHNLALTWENEATRAKELEVTQLTDDPVVDDPLLKVQAEIAKSLAREEQAHEERLQKELRKRLRANRIPNKG